MFGVTRVRVRPVLADVGRINTLFRLEEDPPGPGWRGLGGDGVSAEAFAVEVERVRARLAELSRPDALVEWRVAASVFQQGLATRLLSPVLAAGLCHGVLLDAAAFHWRPDRKGPVVLRSSQECAVTGGVDAVADWIEETVVSGVMARVSRALPRIGKVAPGLLRGNTAAALAGAVRALGADRPEARADAEALARTLLARPALAGTGGYVGVDEAGLAVFRRTTCCLYYQLPGSGVCGDCALRTQD